MQAPTITPVSVSPVLSLEGEPVTLNWTYDLHGRAFQQMFFGHTDTPVLVQLLPPNPFLFADGFSNRISVSFNATETSYASFTFNAVNRTDSNMYKLTIQSFGGGFTTSDPAVELKVQCK